MQWSLKQAISSQLNNGFSNSESTIYLPQDNGNLCSLYYQALCNIYWQITLYTSLFIHSWTLSSSTQCADFCKRTKSWEPCTDIEEFRFTCTLHVKRGIHLHVINIYQFVLVIFLSEFSIEKTNVLFMLKWTSVDCG